jgi:hypothetical protein
MPILLDCWFSGAKTQIEYYPSNGRQMGNLLHSKRFGTFPRLPSSGYQMDIPPSQNQMTIKWQDANQFRVYGTRIADKFMSDQMSISLRLTNSLLHKLSAQ